MSLQTSVPSILVHGIIFAFLYRSISHHYWQYVQRQKAEKWSMAVRAMEQDVVNQQIANMYVNQQEQQQVLRSLVEKCNRAPAK